MPPHPQERPCQLQLLHLATLLTVLINCYFPSVHPQERLELLETENDLLLAQQGELEEEIQRLGKLLQDKDTQVPYTGLAGMSRPECITPLRCAAVPRSKGECDMLHCALPQLAEVHFAAADNL